MAVKTTQEQLEEVQTAITAILTGSQSVSINGRSLTRADLGVLYRREKELEAKLARKRRGPISVLRAVPK